MDSKESLLLNIENLHVHFVSKEETVKALNGVDLKVARGRTIGIVGETGAGKTTTALSILNMIQKPQGKVISGKITLGDIDIFSQSDAQMSEIRGNKVSMIFQDPMSSLQGCRNAPGLDRQLRQDSRTARHQSWTSSGDHNQSAPRES